ncbi:MAG: FAD-dependent oxidoreductase [Planctomycetaceae bacterium]
MSDSDVLIVGQGLAGSCIAWSLHWAGRQVMIVDRGEEITASRIAAGLMTPVTGRRMVPTQGYKESYRHAAAFYRRIERELNCQLLEEKPAVRQFVSDDEQNVFEKKFRGSDVCFAVLKDDAGRVTGIEMRDATRLNVPRFLDQTRQYFSSLGLYRQAELNPDTDIVIDESGVVVARLDVRSASVVWCQGYQAKRNHWFPTIPDGPAKGEILRVRLSDYREDRVVHKGIWLVPDRSAADEPSFLLGATYDRVNLNNEPTAAGREELLSGLKQITEETPVVLGHVAAVRAGMKRRRPIVGPHPDSDHMFVLNGLGSRGAVLAPVAAQALTDLMSGASIRSDLDKLIDILPGRPHTELATSNASRPKSLTQLAHNLIRRIVQPGDTVIDATAGNGNDTQMLATLVGAAGRTIAIDIQQSAIDSTSNRLAKAGLTVDLRLGDHASELMMLLTSGLCVKAVMFNLGYLPGSDKRITTLSTSTRAAIQAACEMLLPGGAVTIIAYRGHAGGPEEAVIVEQWITELPSDRFETSRIEGDPTQATSPVLFVVRNVSLIPRAKQNS